MSAGIGRERTIPIGRLPPKETSATVGVDEDPVGAILALCAPFAHDLITATRLVIAIVMVLPGGLAFGAVSGLDRNLSSRSAFIATLVSMTVLRGDVLVFSNHTRSTSSGHRLHAFGNLGGATYSACQFRRRGCHRLAGCWSRSPRPAFAAMPMRLAAMKTYPALGVNVTLDAKIVIYAVSVSCRPCRIILQRAFESAQPSGESATNDTIAAVDSRRTTLAGNRRHDCTLIGDLIIGILNDAAQSDRYLRAHYRIDRQGSI